MFQIGDETSLQLNTNICDQNIFYSLIISEPQLSLILMNINLLYGFQ
jgi:hypothetical protein